MINPVTRANLNFYLRHPWQLGLSILGIVLGIAVVVSIDLARISAEYAFERSSNAIAGRTTHRIVGGPGGIAESVYTALRVEHGLHQLAPIVQGQIQAGDETDLRTLTLLGIDVFADANFRAYSFSNVAGADDRGEVITGLLQRENAVLMDEATARATATRPGASLQVSIGKRQAELQLLQYLKVESETSAQDLTYLLIADIATAQELLGLQGKLSHIDLLVAEGEEGESQLRQIAAVLPADLEIVTAEARNQSMTQMTRAFHINLTALSLLALLVGMFLIYNTMTFMVLKRRHSFGILRSLGVTRQQMFQFVLMEALCIGFIAVLIGIPAGSLLGKLLLQLVNRTINDLYYVIPASQLALSPLSWAKGITLGLLATLAAAMVPAWEAAKVTPKEAMSRADLEARSRSWIGWAALPGIAALLTGGLVIMLSSKGIVAGFTGIFIIIIGCVLLTPLCSVIIMTLFSIPASFIFGASGKLAMRSVRASLSRTVVAVSALMVAFATVIGIGLMISSFRGSVELWLSSLLRADMYIGTPGPASAGSHYDLDQELADRIRSLPQVKDLSTIQVVQIESSIGITELAAYESTDDSWKGFRFKESFTDGLREKFENEDLVIVSEPYAWHHDVEKGDKVELRTDHGRRSFTIGGIYYDYRSEQGIVAMSRRSYNRYWNDRAYSGFGIYLEAGAETLQLRDQLQALVPGQSLWIEDRQTIRERSLVIFDQTFAITSVLRILAAIIAFLGLFSALMALQLERSREFAIYRAIGFLPRQLWKMVVSESVLLGFIAGLIAIPVGCLISFLLVTIINRRSFGWSMELLFDPEFMLQGMLLALCAAAMAGLYPGYKISRTAVAEALRAE